MASKKKSSKGTRPRRYWLFKSEPDSYSFDELKKDKRTFWTKSPRLLTDTLRLNTL